MGHSAWTCNTLCAGNLINTIIFGSDHSEQRGIGERALQTNGAPHTIAFISTSVILILKETTNIWLSALKALASLVGLASSPDLSDQAQVMFARIPCTMNNCEGTLTTRTSSCIIWVHLSQGLPSFATAVRSRLIIGPSTYAIEASSKYAVAFRKTTSDGPNPEVSVKKSKVMLDLCHYLSALACHSKVHTIDTAGARQLTPLLLRDVGTTLHYPLSVNQFKTTISAVMSATRLLRKTV